MEWRKGGEEKSYKMLSRKKHRWVIDQIKAMVSSGED